MSTAALSDCDTFSAHYTIQSSPAMHSSYYSRTPAVSLLEQRGQTAVLGTGTASASATSSADAGAVDAGTSTPRPSAAVLAANSKVARGIGRRKLRRSENARLSSNPHIVRPGPRDYSLRHNDRHSSFPLPPELQQVYAASMRGEKVASSGSGSTSNSTPMEGPFTMSHSDAHWFLSHRCGVRPCGLEAAAPASLNPSKNDETSDRGLGAIQLFVKRAEAIMATWLTQDVFLQPPRDASRDTADDAALIDLRSLQTGMGDARDLRLFEVTRNPHNLVWNIPDPFMRLAIHCLARTLACPSFSKDSPRPADSSYPSPTRQTWILKGRSYGVKAGHGPSRQGPAPEPALASAPSDLETPPATDIGSELASDIAHSELASDVESDWIVSDIAEDAAIEDSGGEEVDDWQTAADASRLTQDGDVTLSGASRTALHKSSHLLEDETGDWADAESDGGA